MVYRHNTVDFDNLPITVDPMLNQEVLNSLKEISSYKVDDIDYHELFIKLKIKAFKDLCNLNVIYLEPNFYKLM